MLKIPTQFCLQLAASIAGFERKFNARKPRSLKSGGGGLKPSSLIEVCAYDHESPRGELFLKHSVFRIEAVETTILGGCR